MFGISIDERRASRCPEDASSHGHFAPRHFVASSGRSRLLPGDPVRKAIALLLGIIAGSLPAQQQQGTLRAPVTTKHPHVTEIHGRKLVDDYFWLRKKGDPEVVQFLEAENAYTVAMTKNGDALRQTIYDEMLKRIKQTDTTASYRRGNYQYFS